MTTEEENKILKEFITLILPSFETYINGYPQKVYNHTDFKHYKSSIENKIKPILNAVKKQN